MSLRKLSIEERAQLYERVEVGELSVRDALRALRRSIGLSQRAYTKVIGMAARTVIEFESGKGNPTVATLGRMFQPFGLEMGLRRRADGD